MIPGGQGLQTGSAPPAEATVTGNARGRFTCMLRLFQDETCFSQGSRLMTKHSNRFGEIVGDGVSTMAEVSNVEKT